MLSKILLHRKKDKRIKEIEKTLKERSSANSEVFDKTKNREEVYIGNSNSAENNYKEKYLLEISIVEKLEAENKQLLEQLESIENPNKEVKEVNEEDSVKKKKSPNEKNSDNLQKHTNNEKSNLSSKKNNQKGFIKFKVEEIQESEDPNYLFNETQLKEFSYILLKNLEAKQVTMKSLEVYK